MQIHGDGYVGPFTCTPCLDAYGNPLGFDYHSSPSTPPPLQQASADPTGYAASNLVAGALPVQAVKIPTAQSTDGKASEGGLQTGSADGPGSSRAMRTLGLVGVSLGGVLIIAGVAGPIYLFLRSARTSSAKPDAGQRQQDKKLGADNEVSTEEPVRAKKQVKTYGRLNDEV